MSLIATTLTKAPPPRRRRELPLLEIAALTGFALAALAWWL